MHQPTLLGLTVIGGFAFQALADNAHLKVQFFADSNCVEMKPDNDRNPSDLNPRKNECERPDHHLPSEGFGFRSIKYSLRGDDWKNNMVKKYHTCTLHAFHEKECEDKKHKMLEPGWSFDHHNFYEEANSTVVCHTLTDHDDDAQPFYSLMLNCKKQHEEPKMTTAPIAVIPVSYTKTETYVTHGSTSESTDVEVEKSTLTEKISTYNGYGTSAPDSSKTPTVVYAASPTTFGGPYAQADYSGDMRSPTVVVVAPTLTHVIPYSNVLYRPEGTVTEAELARRRFHARDVTAKAVSSRCACSASECSCKSSSGSTTYSHPAPTSYQAVVNEQDVYNLVEELSEDLGEWITDLEATVEQTEKDVEDVECNNGDCQEVGDDLWPSVTDNCSAQEQDATCGDVEDEAESSTSSTISEVNTSAPSSKR